MSAPKDTTSLSYTRAAELLSYDPLTGELRWRVARRNGYPAGIVAGGVGPDGYWTICIDLRAYKGHRLAWLLFTGVWPQAEIDHINRNRIDNRIENLREANRSQNQVNSGTYRNNRSGYRNVHFHKLTGKYVAEIIRDKKRRHLGLFLTPEEAYECVRRNLPDGPDTP